MAEVTIDAAGEEIGPVKGKSVALGLSGTMSAGYIVIEYQLPGSEVWFPGDVVTVSKLEQVGNQAEDGYGYVTEIANPIGGFVRARASDSFSGTLTGYLAVAN